MAITRAILAASLLAATIAPSFANWQAEISGFDRDRLARIDEARTSGLAQSDGASAADRSAINGVLGPLSSPISAQDLTGTWRCRLMKLGGLAPAIVYGWQTCRFRETANGLFFEKTSGTQRFSGYADPDGAGSFILLAAMTVKDERQRVYSGAGNSAGAAATPNDQVGVVSSIGPSHARIEFPFPVLESTFDVIELTR